MAEFQIDLTRADGSHVTMSRATERTARNVAEFCLRRRCIAATIARRGVTVATYPEVTIRPFPVYRLYVDVYGSPTGQPQSVTLDVRAPDAESARRKMYGRAVYVTPDGKASLSIVTRDLVYTLGADSGGPDGHRYPEWLLRRTRKFPLR